MTLALPGPFTPTNTAQPQLDVNPSGPPLPPASETVSQPPRPFEWPPKMQRVIKTRVAQVLWTLHLDGDIEDDNAADVLRKRLRDRGVNLVVKQVTEILRELEGGRFGRLVARQKNRTITQKIWLLVGPESLPENPFQGNSPAASAARHRPPQHDSTVLRAPVLWVLHLDGAIHDPNSMKVLQTRLTQRGVYAAMDPLRSAVKWLAQRGAVDRVSKSQRTYSIGLKLPVTELPPNPFSDDTPAQPEPQLAGVDSVSGFDEGPVPPEQKLVYAISVLLDVQGDLLHRPAMNAETLIDQKIGQALALAQENAQLRDLLAERDRQLADAARLNFQLNQLMRARRTSAGH